MTAESVVDEHKVAATITALKKLEGLLMLYGNKVNKYLNIMQYIHIFAELGVTRYV